MRQRDMARRRGAAAFRSAAGLLLLVAALGAGGCATSTVIYATATATPQPSPTATRPAAPPTATGVTPSSAPPPGIWCPVSQGLTPFVVNCEIYPSTPQLNNPPQGEAGLAGTPVGPQAGSDGPSFVTEFMNAPWAADVTCATSDGSNNGSVRIVMIAHEGSRDYYSWGDEPCGPPSAPYYGNEFFRKATVSVTLRIQPLTGSLSYWSAQLIQL